MKGLKRKHKVFGSPDKKTIVLIFGFGMSIEDWIELGYVDQLKDHFFVIAVDPFDYEPCIKGDTSGLTLDGSSLYIHNLLNRFGKRNAIIWGYSLGAKVALSLYGHYPSLVEGFVLGGFELRSDVDLKNDLVINTLNQGGHAWLNLWKSMFCVPEKMAIRLCNSDTSALIELRKAEAIWPDLTSIAKRCEVNTVIYAGEHCFYRKETEEASEEFSKGYFFEIPNLNHFELLAVPEAISQKIIEQYA